jgi:hypothetical protein
LRLDVAGYELLAQILRSQLPSTNDLLDVPERPGKRHPGVTGDRPYAIHVGAAQEDVVAMQWEES